MEILKQFEIAPEKEMKVNDIVPYITEIQSVYLDRIEKDNSKWLELMTEALKTAGCQFLLYKITC